MIRAAVKSSALAVAQAAELPTLVKAAAEALARATNAAEVLAAGEKAGLVYDAAKRAARLQKAKGAHDELIAATYRVQADSLEIESLAKRRLADEYDAAQARGEVGKKGQRSDLVPAGNKVATAEDVGLTRKQVFESRQIRDAIEQDPGIVRRALDQMLAAGAEPTRAGLKRATNLRAAIGTDTATKAERGNNLYETPIEAMRTLLALEGFQGNVLEPACGRGAILRPLEDAGYEVVLSDLVDYETHDRHGEVQQVADFLAVDAYPARPDIVTNPPYGDVLNAFVAHALKVHRPRKMALLLNLNFLCGTEDDDRNFAMNAGQNPPARIWVFSRRLPMMHRDGWEGPEASSRMNTAWFVWEEGFSGRTGIERVDWKDFQDRPALKPVMNPVAKVSEDNGRISGGAAPMTGETSRPHGADHAGGTPPPIRRDSSERRQPDSLSPEPTSSPAEAETAGGAAALPATKKRRAA
jgi:hypothetical protein